MRFANNPEPKKYKGVAFIICQHFFLKKSGVFEHAKTPSPGRFPEGKAGFPGRHPGSLFLGFSVSSIKWDLSQDISQSDPEKPKSWSQKAPK